MKNAITVHMSAEEFRVLKELAEMKEMTSTQIMRQALRLYQLAATRLGPDATIRINDKTYILVS